MKKPAILLAALLSAAACAMPSTVVRTPEARPSIAVEGAPPGAALYVDGLHVGDAAAFDGQPNVLLVEPGSHEIAVRGRDGAEILRQRIFVESELKTIKVR